MTVVWNSPEPGWPWCHCKNQCRNTPTCTERAQLAPERTPAPELPAYITLEQVPDGPDAWSIRCECGEFAIGGSRWVRDWLARHPEHTRDEIARYGALRILVGRG